MFARDVRSGTERRISDREVIPVEVTEKGELFPGTDGDERLTCEIGTRRIRTK